LSIHSFVDFLDDLGRRLKVDVDVLEICMPEAVGDHDLAGALLGEPGAKGVPKTLWCDWNRLKSKAITGRSDGTEDSTEHPGQRLTCAVTKGW
jgi:hypothetical protein